MCMRECRVCVRGECRVGVHWGYEYEHWCSSFMLFCVFSTTLNFYANSRIRHEIVN